MKVTEKNRVANGNGLTVELPKSRSVSITAPKFEIAEFKIQGIAPLVINKFSQKAREQMLEKHKAGSVSKKGGKREAKDCDLLFNNARHIAREGWDGIPCAAFRAAMISACRLVDFKMTIAKMSIFVEAAGYDRDEGTGLVRIIGSEPRKTEMTVRNETGVPDVRVRPMWDEWSAAVRVRYDAEKFSLEDVTNLMMRAGLQVGVGEGRPDSKASAGMGWGIFELNK